MQKAKEIQIRGNHVTRAVVVYEAALYEGDDVHLKLRPTFDGTYEASVTILHQYENAEGKLSTHKSATFHHIETAAAWLVMNAGFTPDLLSYHGIMLQAPPDY